MVNMKPSIAAHDPSKLFGRRQIRILLALSILIALVSSGVAHNGSQLRKRELGIGFLGDDNFDSDEARVDPVVIPKATKPPTVKESKAPKNTKAPDVKESKAPKNTKAPAVKESKAPTASQSTKAPFSRRSRNLGIGFASVEPEDSVRNDFSEVSGSNDFDDVGLVEQDDIASDSNDYVETSGSNDYPQNPIVSNGSVEEAAASSLIVTKARKNTKSPATKSPALKKSKAHTVPKITKAPTKISYRLLQDAERTVPTTNARKSTKAPASKPPAVKTSKAPNVLKVTKSTKAPVNKMSTKSKGMKKTNSPIETDMRGRLDDGQVDNGSTLFPSSLTSSSSSVGSTSFPPTSAPTASPTGSPTSSPTVKPTDSPTVSPTKSPTSSPTVKPTDSPTVSPTESPTSSPTVKSTDSPTVSSTISNKKTKIEGGKKTKAPTVGNFKKTKAPVVLR